MALLLLRKDINGFKKKKRKNLLNHEREKKLFDIFFDLTMHCAKVFS
jgi:hypothetical protein